MKLGEFHAAVAPPSPEDPGASAPPAWQPFTPQGLVKFAPAPTGRVLLIELILALIAAGAVVWFLQTAWFPIFRAATAKLPLAGSIRNQTLAYPSEAPGLLAEGHFLAFVVKTEPAFSGGLASDLRVEFHQDRVLLCSLPGCATFAYPKGALDFNRIELQPRWDAWEPILLGLAALGTVSLLMLSWSLLATLYFGFAWLIAFFADRQLSLGGSWRLASAALMPGTLLVSLGIVLYGLGVLDLVRFGMLFLLHLLLGPAFTFASLFFLPRSAKLAPLPGNPFTPSTSNPGPTHPFTPPPPEPTPTKTSPPPPPEPAPSNPFAPPTPEPAPNNPFAAPTPEPRPSNPFAPPPPEPGARGPYTSEGGK